MALESTPPQDEFAMRAARAALRPVVWTAAWLAVSDFHGFPIIAGFATAAFPIGIAAVGYPSRLAPWLVPVAAMLELGLAGLVVAMAGHALSPWLLLIPWLLFDYRWHRNAGRIVLLAGVPACVAAFGLAGIPWPDPVTAAYQGLVFLVTVVYVLADRGRRVKDPVGGDRPADGAAAAWDAFRHELLGAFERLARGRQGLAGIDGESPAAPGARALARALRQLGGGAGQDGMTAVTFHQFEPGRLLEKACDDWSACAGLRGMDLQGYVAPGAGGIFFGDRERMSDVLDLLFLAGCYSARDGLTVLSIDASGGDEAGEAVTLTLAVYGDTDHDFPAEGVRDVIYRWVDALGARCDLGGPLSAKPWWIQVPLDRQAREETESGTDALRGVSLCISGDSPLRTIVLAYVSEAGAELVDDASTAGVILLAQSARDPGTEARCEDLQRRHPRTPLLCLGGTNVEASGILLETDGIIPLPFSRDALVEQVLKHAGARQSTSPSPWPRPSAEEPARGQGEGLVLVAEDDAISARVVTRFLEGEGFEVTRVADGNAALEALKAGGHRLALLDMHMPGLGGVEVATRLRAWEAETARGPVPLIALTASAADADRRACLEAGMDDFLNKPVDRGALRSMLDSTMHRSGNAYARGE